MAYRLVRIHVRRHMWFAYSATAILEDDGLDENGEELLFRGFDLEDGPYDALTHRRAWRKALRANGGKLWYAIDTNESR